MPVHDVTLDFNKTFRRTEDVVVVGVGDKESQVLRAHLYDKGVPVQPTGTLRIQIRGRSGNLVRSFPMTHERENIWTGIIPTQAFVEHGEAKQALVAEYESGKAVAVTSRFKLRVEPGITDAPMVEYYDEQLEKMMEDVGAAGSEVEQNEAARQQAERERAQAEVTRQSQESDRQSAESARAQAEGTRDTAETQRVAAESLRVESENARETSEDAREQAEETRESNETERRAAEQDRDSAETLRDDAERARAEAEGKRATAETAREEAETARAEAEDARAEAEQGRSEAEDVRVEAEAARDTASTERDTAERERKHYEDQRRAAEIQRQRAEVQRNANETTRKRQEDERVVADELRTTQQAKNNADQAANNLAAQGQQRVFLIDDQFDPETRVPTIEGEFGIIYCVPRQDPEEVDQYIEWIVTYGSDGSKRWERVGTSDIVLPDPITTDQIDQIVDEDASLQGTELQNAASLSYFWQKIKGWVTKAIADAPAKQPDPRALRAKLAEANAAKEAAVMAGVGSDYDFGTIVTQQADYDTFCAAIDAAQAIYDEHYSQEELDDATATLDEALGTFKAASREVTADMSKWTPLVETYESRKSTVHESEDGSDVRNGETWATPAEWSAYDSAYTKAKGEVEGATKQSQIDSAVSDLTAAQTTFGSAIKTAETSTDALQAAITAANAAMDGIKTSADGMDVYDFERWATEGDFTTLRAAIASATETLSSGCSQDELDEATATLQAATSTFEGAVQDGLRHIQYGTLDGLISAAQDLLDETATSESNGEDVSVHVQWTTPEDRASFEAAKQAAETVRSSARTQEAVDEAASTLQAATEAFEAARKPGLKPIDLQELDSQLSAARQALSGSHESTDGRDVPNGEQWSTAEHRQTLQSAITEAERVRSESTQQDEVDAEAKTLEAAVTAYNATLQTAVTSTEALSEAIESANSAKADVQTSDQEGEDLPSGSKYVTSEQMSTFEAAIRAATTAMAESTTQAQLDAATSALTAATATFSEQIQTNFTPPEDIADASWDDIAQLSALAAESPQDYTKYIGQTKTIDMSSLGNGCTNVTVRVIGVGHDVDPYGKTLGLTFQLTDGLPYQTFTMNSSNVNTGGWRDSLMRSTNIKKVEDALPADLKPLLKTMVKKTYLAESEFNSGQPTETQDKLALLSQTEVFGDEVNPQSSWTWPKGEGKRYQWYVEHDTNNDRIIKRADGSANGWWLRSVHSTTYFRIVNSSGALSNDNASVQRLPCACFSV